MERLALAANWKCPLSDQKSALSRQLTTTNLQDAPRPFFFRAFQDAVSIIAPLSTQKALSQPVKHTFIHEQICTQTTQRDVARPRR
jgi:hypothetical protein